MNDSDARRIRQAAFDRLTAGSGHVLALARDALGEVAHDTIAFAKVEGAHLVVISDGECWTVALLKGRQVVDVAFERDRWGNVHRGPLAHQDDEHGGER
ncbi:hypothetical protein [Paraburkholderia guartelaensis]|uniref:Heme-binding protein n=1 Tax=Paraburkholderia guartelaensis TaxID=2546446 RepID=A0ABU9SJM8_9BURK